MVKASNTESKSGDLDSGQVVHIHVCVSVLTSIIKLAKNGDDAMRLER